MTIKQVRAFYENKELASCPVTTRLIQSGFQQTSGGYIRFARQQGIQPDYKKAIPSQWWHLIHSYCAHTDENQPFTRRVQCGELIFWMAEVAECVEPVELDRIADAIMEQNMTRREANRFIQDHCFDRIVEKVEASVFKKEA